MFNLTPIEKERAISLHKESIVVDAHCDTLLDIVQGKRELGERSITGHVDLERLRTGGISVQFFAAFIENCYKPGRCLKRTIQLLDAFFREVEKNKDKICHVRNYKDIEKASKDKKIAALLSIEGGEALEGELATLRLFYRVGVRSLGLTWNQRNELADGIWERKSGGGLTTFGRQVVKEMNSLGMLVDLSHLAEKGFWDTLEISTKPLVVSHANCQQLCPHPRNLNDKQILALAHKGGVMGITFAPEFLGRKDTHISRVLDHIDHVANLVGTEYIGIGSDFDGIDVTPKGLPDVSEYINITLGLVERGYTDQEIRRILGGNFLRVIREVLH